MKIKISGMHKDAKGGYGLGPSFRIHKNLLSFPYVTPLNVFSFFICFETGSLLGLAESAIAIKGG